MKRMARLLEEQFGAKGATPASINLRSVDFTDQEPAPLGESNAKGVGATEAEREQEAAFASGRVAHGSADAWHWDNTRYMGPHF